MFVRALGSFKRRRELTNKNTMSKDLSKFNVISSRPLEYVERYYPEYEMALSRKSDNDNEEYEQMYLYQVFLKRTFRAGDGGSSARSPITSNYFVLAQDEEGAILQVQGNAFPEKAGCVLDVEQSECLSATAHRILFQIRGWGSSTF